MKQLNLEISPVKKTNRGEANILKHIYFLTLASSRWLWSVGNILQYILESILLIISSNVDCVYNLPKRIFKHSKIFVINLVDLCAYEIFLTMKFFRFKIHNIRTAISSMYVYMYTYIVCISANNL